MLLMLSVICMLLLSTMAVALPSQQQVVALMGKNFKNIRDYKVDAVLSVKSPSINISAMPMTVYYKQPGRVHIDTNEGFAMVPRDMVLGNPAEDMAKSSNVTVLGQQKIAGRNAIVVKMTPKAKSENGGDHSMKMWIDAERGLVLSTVAGENSGLRFKSTWTYTQIDSKYWLPSEIRAEISNVGSNEKVLPRHKMHSPKVGDGSTVIKFRNYRVNKGIPDSVFKKPAKH